ncbi:hypothetical protein LCGC14_1679580 [marine sediment metagenome]|uniref:Uncharacterized protein n=1 Tax=marine sediment metagenome TaxID=412755 RepID=A0A0F9HP46_9ZZZZ|nr:hypothetical protein [Pricia sp.]
MTEIMDATQTEPTQETSTEQTSTEQEQTPTNWYGEEHNDLVKAKGWDVNGFLKSYKELEKFKGVGEHLLIPESAEDADGWNKIYTQLGRPESSEKYTFTNETGVKISDELMAGFKKFAFVEGYTQKQLAGAIQFQLEAVKASEEVDRTQREQLREENVSNMKQKWQDGYEPTIIKIDNIAEKLGIKSYFEDLGIDKEPEIVNMLLTIANSDSDSQLTTTGHTPPASKTLQERLKDVMASDAHKNEFHVDHKKAQAEFLDINMQIANSGQGIAPRE